MLFGFQTGTGSNILSGNRGTFVIRVAGNVVDSHQLGSIEYAADHLDCKLVVVLGHNHCGAVEAAIKHDPDGHIKYITDDIREAIKEEKDEYIATCLNVKHSVKVIEENTDMKLLEERGLRLSGLCTILRTGMWSFWSKEWMNVTLSD